MYLAEHVAIRRPLALKLLHPEVEGIDGISERFQREAFAIGRVDHPNCVNVSDFGQLEDGTLLTSYASTAYMNQPPDRTVCEVVRWRMPDELAG